MSALCTECNRNLKNSTALIESWIAVALERFLNNRVGKRNLETSAVPKQ